MPRAPDTPAERTLKRARRHYRRLINDLAQDGAESLSLEPQPGLYQELTDMFPDMAVVRAGDGRVELHWVNP